MYRVRHAEPAHGEEVVNDMILLAIVSTVATLLGLAVGGAIAIWAMSRQRP
jgi:hypothetical protein